MVFSDIPNNRVLKWKDGEGLTTYLRPAGYTGTKPRGGETGSNGLLRDPDGNFVEFSYGQPLGPGAEAADADALPKP